jgi:hypothetical protein
MAKIRLPHNSAHHSDSSADKDLAGNTHDGNERFSDDRSHKEPQLLRRFCEATAVPGFFGIDSAVRVGTIPLQSDVISPRRNVSKIFTAM